MRMMRRAAALVALAIALTMLPGGAASALTTGPTSPYYLSNYSASAIYVVQGTTIVDSFAWAYGGSASYPEGTLAVSGGTVRTRPFWSSSGTVGGQYTLDGTPTGTAYTYALAPGVTNEESYDATSDGAHNYYVPWWSSINSQYVYRTGLGWENPTPLFSVGSPCCEELSIAWDPTNNSLWIGDYNGTAIRNYSMSGTLLSSFSTGHSGNSSLAYDPADNTLWLARSGGNQLEQWSKTGVLLQSGAPTGLPGGGYSGEFAMVSATVPAPGALVIVALGLMVLGTRKRKPGA